MKFCPECGSQLPMGTAKFKASSFLDDNGYKPSSYTGTK